MSYKQRSRTEIGSVRPLTKEEIDSLSEEAVYVYLADIRRHKK